MSNIAGIIKSLQNIMRKDQGVSGDAQRIEQLGWMITLKILDDKDAELELLSDDYVSAIPSELQWRSWAADSEGITGDALKDFIDNRLFPGLQNLDVSFGGGLDTDSDSDSNVRKRAVLIRDIFSGTNNYMKNGTKSTLTQARTGILSATFTKASCVTCRARATTENSTRRARLRKS